MFAFVNARSDHWTMLILLVLIDILVLTLFLVIKKVVKDKRQLRALQKELNNFNPNNHS